VGELWIRMNYQTLMHLMTSLKEAHDELQGAMDKAAADPDRCKPHTCMKLGCKERVTDE